MKDLAQTTGDTTVTRERIFYKLQRGDILYIRVITGNPEIDQLFNLNNGMQNRNNANILQQSSLMGGGLYFQGYSVDESGNIDMPVIDKIEVVGKTVDEVKKIIEDNLTQYIEEALVIVKLENFKVTYLGEFRSTGVKELQVNKLNVMEAMGHTGGITDRGNLKQLKVIRPLENGSRIYTLNMTDKHIITNSEFELLPNDVLYVPPRKNAWLRDETSQSFTFWLTTTATSLSTILLIISLSTK